MTDPTNPPAETIWDSLARQSEYGEVIDWPLLVKTVADCLARGRFLEKENARLENKVLWLCKHLEAIWVVTIGTSSNSNPDEVLRLTRLALKGTDEEIAKSIAALKPEEVSK